MANKHLYTIEQQNISTFNTAIQKEALCSLESGKIIYCPSLTFSLNPKEQALFSHASLLDATHKNIGYNYHKQQLGVTQSRLPSEVSNTIQQLMHRYAEFTKQLLDGLLPQYREHLRWGRTSYRPAEIEGRKTSRRKDDTQVHVDSFSASPVYGLRILRVFCNINPYDKPRVWHLGDTFPEVLAHFAAQIPSYNIWRARILRLTRTTKTLRSAYDHYMLNLHDRMKCSAQYQQQLNKQRFDFPSQSTWIVFTDQVSHAALSGQFLLEQTFYLPVAAMANPEHSPLRQWEQHLGYSLM